jgi:hypothetical protein
MSRILLAGTLVVALISAAGCQSNSYGTATKKILKKMVELQLAMNKVTKENASTQSSTINGLIQEITELHTNRESAMPDDPDERIKIKVKFGGPFMNVLASLHMEREKVVAIPEASSVVQPLDSLLKTLDAEAQIILMDARFEHLRPTKAKKGGGGGMGSGGIPMP